MSVNEPVIGKIEWSPDFSGIKAASFGPGEMVIPIDKVIDHDGSILISHGYVPEQALQRVRELIPVGLMTASNGYKPHRYPWAHEFWKKQQKVHWMGEEVPLGEDCKDWAVNITPAEKNLLTHIFRFFTQADIEVADNYMERYARVFKPTEVKMMLASFANMETVHIDAYALLLETVGMPETEFGAFMEYGALRDKHDFMATFGTDSDEDILRTLAMFGGFAEGVQLFASFAMLMNFPRHGKMKGMGQIVSWSVRDESLHCEGIIKLFHAFASETGALSQTVKDDIVECCRTVVAMEDRFIDLAFEMGPVDGMTSADVKSYVRFIADWRLRQLGLPEVYGVKINPLPWLQEMLSGVEHANFFEAKATEYSKGASEGTWPNVWQMFDAA
jgi:ribonucleoside-diphosphate reductase beta chain